MARNIPRHLFGLWLRLAVIADNSAKSIEAFVRANVKLGATIIDGHAAYPGLSGDYRHDPRVVGNMAASIVLPWSHRAFSRLLKRWALGTYHGLRRKHVDAYLNEFPYFATTGRFHRHVSFETVLGLGRAPRPRDLPRHRQPRRRLTKRRFEQSTTYRSP